MSKLDSPANKLSHYLILGTLLFITLLALKFPYRKLEKILISYISRSTNGLVEVRHLKINPLGRVYLEDISLKTYFCNKPYQLHSRHITAHLKWFNLLIGKPTFHFKATLSPENYLTGNISLKRKKSKTFISLQIKDNKFKLKNLVLSTNFYNIKLTTDLSINLMLDSFISDYKNGTGTIFVEGEKGEINISNFITSDIKTFIIKLDLANEELKITSCLFEGSKLNLDATGKIKLKSMLSSSQSDINILINFNNGLQASLENLFPFRGLIKNNKLSLKITGPLASPRFIIQK